MTRRLTVKVNDGQWVFESELPDDAPRPFPGDTMTMSQGGRRLMVLVNGVSMSDDGSITATAVPYARRVEQIAQEEA